MTYLRTGLSLSSTLTLSALVLASPALGQEGSARQGVLTFSQGLEISDNRDLAVSPTGTDILSRTALTFAFSSETRTQAFNLNFGTQLLGDFGDSAGDTFSIDNSFVDMRFRREGPGSALEFSAGYRETNLADEVLDLGGGSSVIIDSGTATTTNLALGFDTGIGGPLGFEFDARTRNVDYQNTTDPDLNDTTTVRLDGVAHFQIAPALSARARAGTSITDEDDAASTETTRSYVGVGLEGQTAGGLNFVGDLLFDKTEVTVAGPSTTTDDGLGFEVSVSQDRGNGRVGVDVASRVDDDGRRSSAEFKRRFDVPSGDLAFAVGVVDQDGDPDLRVIGSLDYSRETPDGGFKASLTRDTSISDGLPRVSTGLRLSYSQDINEVSGWGAGISYFASEEIGGTDDDSRASANLSYTRALNDTWDMRAGLEHRRVTESGGSARSSNTVFFNIERDITFGF